MTSQQIIRSPHTNAINSQIVIRNVSTEPSATPSGSITNDATVTFKLPSPRQPPQQNKFKATPIQPSAVAAPSNNVPSTEFNKQRLTTATIKQQTTPPAPPPPSNVAALQRLSSNTTITKLTKPQQNNITATNKLPVLNKQNITISRITTQAVPKQQEVKATSVPVPTMPPSLVMAQAPSNVITIANQRKINRKPPEQLATQRPKVPRPQQQILPVPPQPSAQPQQQTANNSSSGDTATATSTLTCPTCQREFKKKEHLTQHIKLHAGIRPFKCTEEGCDKAFSRKEHLSRHLVSHSGQKKFTCEECKKPFSRKDNLNKHKR